MFKNLIVHRLIGGWPEVESTLDDLLARAVFAPCGPTQPMSSGFVPPRGLPHAPLAERVGDHWLFQLRTEQRLLPGSVVREYVDELAEKVEHETGRAPGRKRRQELKDEAVQTLLPQAFTRRGHVRIWVDPVQQLLMIDAGSATRADEAVTQFLKALEPLAAAPLMTAMSPSAAMSGWLLDDEAPAGFSVDRDCELKAGDDSRSAVRYASHPLDIEEVRAHVQAGKRPTRLAMTWASRVSFVLTEQSALKRLKFLDVVMQDRPGGLSDDEAFDADAAIATGELSRLLPDLLLALGGIADPAAGLPGAAVPAPGQVSEGASSTAAANAALPPSSEPTPWDEQPGDDQNRGEGASRLAA